ncbi:hypothetical protein E2C01_048260 [Portunus trituberculatus]|uniref:Uncharacterized protein n=1 Tax=Portunus trituberculatus TaxID=210409 RepID=A0A5B7G9Q8_PORTR|nr:hypothetical protein [Portunus trituberculatus]
MNESAIDAPIMKHALCFLDGVSVTTIDSCRQDLGPQQPVGIRFGITFCASQAVTDDQPFRKLTVPHRDTTKHLTSDLSEISDQDRENLVLVFNASKTQFLHLSTQHKLSDNYPFFFNDTELSSSTVNILYSKTSLDERL